MPPAGDELSKLGGTLNEMLERLERSAERERGFVASASHELRTPLALLRRSWSWRCGRAAAPRSCARPWRPRPSESDRLVQLAEDLLVLARADEGRLPVAPSGSTPPSCCIRLRAASRRAPPRPAAS